MEKQVLSIEQMQELKELGIDISKASMVWYPKMAIDTRTNKGYVESHYLTINHIDCDSFWNTREGRETIPTFTLHDILEILPEETRVVVIRSNPEKFLIYAFKWLKWCKQNNYM